jgi:CBS domain containing-hemolysin-like protein
MQNISIKAVLLASLAVFGLDIVSGMVLLATFGGAVLDPAMSDTQMQAAITQIVQGRGYLTAALILGTTTTVLGGYLAARLSSSVPYFNALAFAILGIVVTLLTSEGLPMWFLIVGLLLTIPAALFGAYIEKRRVRTARK